jgi:nucleosome binding factor SPN SPT16 subunit
MNKYVLRIPYSYYKFGNYSCVVYADSEEEALEMAREFSTHHSEDYNDSENDGDMDFEYSDTDAELEEENVQEPVNITSDESPFSKIPSYFLAELQQL